MASTDEITLMLTLPATVFNELLSLVTPVERAPTLLPPRPMSRPAVVKAALGEFLMQARSAPPAAPAARQRQRSIARPVTVQGRRTG